jgi:arsenate reductase
MPNIRVKIYEYSQCSTCRKALKFLEARGVDFQKIPIVETPPSKSELKTMLDFLDGDFRKLFNTSGVLYREMKLSQKIASMSANDAIDLLAKNGKLIKRPFLITDKVGLVGFNESAWAKVFSKS